MSICHLQIIFDIILVALIRFKQGVANMKAYEIVAKFCNACAGSSRPQTFFEEAELENTDDFIRMQHSKDFKEFAKETLPTGQIIYKYDNGSVMYSYEFTDL